jgi:hypothetical protein
MRTRPFLLAALVAALLLVAAVPAGAAGPETPRTWGSNTFGELDDGTTTTRRTIPVPVLGITGIETVTAGRAYSAAR